MLLTVQPNTSLMVAFDFSSAFSVHGPLWLSSWFLLFKICFSITSITRSLWTIFSYDKHDKHLEIKLPGQRSASSMTGVVDRGGIAFSHNASDPGGSQEGAAWIPGLSRDQAPHGCHFTRQVAAMLDSHSWTEPRYRLGPAQVEAARWRLRSASSVTERSE